LRAKNVLNRTRSTILGIVLNKSHWPEYGYIREYQRRIAQSRTIAVATLSQNASSTSPANDIVDTALRRTSQEKVVGGTSGIVRPLDEDIAMLMTSPLGRVADKTIPETSTIIDEQVKPITQESPDASELDTTITFPRNTWRKSKDES
jgi:hypothetical protein